MFNHKYISRLFYAAFFCGIFSLSSNVFAGSAATPTSSPEPQTEFEEEASMCTLEEAAKLKNPSCFIAKIAIFSEIPLPFPHVNADDERFVGPTFFYDFYTPADYLQFTANAAKIHANDIQKEINGVISDRNNFAKDMNGRIEKINQLKLSYDQCQDSKDKSSLKDNWLEAVQEAQSIAQEITVTFVIDLDQWQKKVNQAKNAALNLQRVADKAYDKEGPYDGTVIPNLTFPNLPFPVVVNTNLFFGDQGPGAIDPSEDVIPIPFPEITQKSTAIAHFQTALQAQQHEADLAKHQANIAQKTASQFKLKVNSDQYLLNLLLSNANAIAHRILPEVCLSINRPLEGCRNNRKVNEEVQIWNMIINYLRRTQVPMNERVLEGNAMQLKAYQAKEEALAKQKTADETSRSLLQQSSNKPMLLLEKILPFPDGKRMMPFIVSSDTGEFTNHLHLSPEEEKANAMQESVNELIQEANDGQENINELIQEANDTFEDYQEAVEEGNLDEAKGYKKNWQKFAKKILQRQKEMDEFTDKVHQEQHQTDDYIIKVTLNIQKNQPPLPQAPFEVPYELTKKPIPFEEESSTHHANEKIAQAKNLANERQKTANDLIDQANETQRHYRKRTYSMDNGVDNEESSIESLALLWKNQKEMALNAQEKANNEHCTAQLIIDKEVVAEKTIEQAKVIWEESEKTIEQAKVIWEESGKETPAEEVPHEEIPTESPPTDGGTDSEEEITPTEGSAPVPVTPSTPATPSVEEIPTEEPHPDASPPEEEPLPSSGGGVPPTDEENKNNLEELVAVHAARTFVIDAFDYDLEAIIKKLKVPEQEKTVDPFKLNTWVGTEQLSKKPTIDLSPLTAPVHTDSSGLVIHTGLDTAFVNHTNIYHVGLVAGGLYGNSTIIDNKNRMVDLSGYHIGTYIAWTDQSPAKGYLATSLYQNQFKHKLASGYQSTVSGWQLIGHYQWFMGNYFSIQPAVRLHQKYYADSFRDSSTDLNLDLADLSLRTNVHFQSIEPYLKTTYCKARKTPIDAIKEMLSTEGGINYIFTENLSGNLAIDYSKDIEEAYRELSVGTGFIYHFQDDGLANIQCGYKKNSIEKANWYTTIDSSFDFNENITVDVGINYTSQDKDFVSHVGINYQW